MKRFRPGAPENASCSTQIPFQTRPDNIYLIKCYVNVSPLTYLCGLARICRLRGLYLQKYVPGVLILIVQFVREINHVHPALFNNAGASKKRDESKIENYTFEFYRRMSAGARPSVDY